MAVKREPKKGGKRTAEKKETPVKITLPPSGLAEEILGVRSAEEGQKTDDREQTAGGLISKTGTPQSEIEQAPEFHLVTFNLDREEFGIEIGSVQEIIRVGQITAVPNAPEFIQGVINLRGRVIPVLNLRRRLNLSDGPLTKNSRIMIVESGKKVLGMLVDSVSQVLRIPAPSVEEPPGEVEQARAYVKGIGKVESRLIMLMDLDKALAKDAAAGETLTRQEMS